MSDAFSRAKCTASGFVQNKWGYSGSRTEMWPDMPSVRFLRAKTRKAPDIWPRRCARWVLKVGKVGMLGRGVPWAIASMAVFSVVVVVRVWFLEVVVVGGFSGRVREGAIVAVVSSSSSFFFLMVSGSFSFFSLSLSNGRLPSYLVVDTKVPICVDGVRMVRCIVCKTPILM